MDSSAVIRIQRKIWTRFLGERSWIARYGDLRARERFGLVSRANYLYGMLRAADVAKYFGKKCVTVVEFGVAQGEGLLNMVHLAESIRKETGVDIRVVGFDTGSGLPMVSGYKDHAELWRPGDFSVVDRDILLKKLDGRAEIIWGDIGETIEPFVETIDPAAPLGFVSVDVDIYSSTKSALRVFAGCPEKYSPAVSMYFDDVRFFFANEWAGELAAIAEFNAEHTLRKIGHDRSIPGRRPVKAESWYAAMYVCHILDHEARNKPRDREAMTMGIHFEFMDSRFLF